MPSPDSLAGLAVAVLAVLAILADFSLIAPHQLLVGQAGKLT